MYLSNFQTFTSGTAWRLWPTPPSLLSPTPGAPLPPPPPPPPPNPPPPPHARRRDEALLLAAELLADCGLTESVRTLEEEAGLEHLRAAVVRERGDHVRGCREAGDGVLVEHGRTYEEARDHQHRHRDEWREQHQADRST